MLFLFFFPLRKYCSYCIAICVNWVMSFCVTQCTIDVVYYMYVFKSNTLGETRGVTLIDTNIHFVNKWGINVALDLNYQRDDACNQIETCRHPFLNKMILQNILNNICMFFLIRFNVKYFKFRKSNDHTVSKWGAQIYHITVSFARDTLVYICHLYRLNWYTISWIVHQMLTMEMKLIELMYIPLILKKHILSCLFVSV